MKPLTQKQKDAVISLYNEKVAIKRNELKDKFRNSDVAKKKVKMALELQDKLIEATKTFQAIFKKVTEFQAENFNGYTLRVSCDGVYDNGRSVYKKVNLDYTRTEKEFKNDLKVEIDDKFTSPEVFARDLEIETLKGTLDVEEFLSRYIK